MKIEQIEKRERGLGKNMPVSWKDERIGVDEERLYPPGYRFSTKEPVPTHYQNKEYWLVGSLDIKISAESTLQGVILVSNDEYHTVISMTRDHWKKYEFVELADRKKMEQGRMAHTPKIDHVDVPVPVKRKEQPVAPKKPEPVPAFWKTVYQKARPQKGLKPAFASARGRHK